jgi:hypothetical protein
MTITNRQVKFTFPVPEGFEAKGWGGSQKYNTIEIEVGFAGGGMNYFSGSSSSRGYYLYFSPVNLSYERGFATREFLVGTGAKQLLQPAARYSASTLAKIVSKVEPIARKLADAYITGDTEAVKITFAPLIQTA